nr:MAG TPA_asm: hypothetical protein [Caudoviricetes sp.]
MKKLDQVLSLITTILLLINVFFARSIILSIVCLIFLVYLLIKAIKRYNRR